LPGGDPLAAALAAGETPSPELVAAAGKGDGPRPAVAIVVFAALLVPLIALPFLANSGTILGLVRPPLAPDVLENRAREIVTRLGYEAGTGLFAMLLVAALGVYGFWTCVAGRVLAGHFLEPR
jgi:serine/threonine-protein kinase